MSCAASVWCNQGEREHVRHELTLGTWPGVSQTGPRRPMVAQLVIHGLDDADAAPMLVLVDGLAQTDVTLSWEQAHAIACSIIGQRLQFARLTAPN